MNHSRDGFYTLKNCTITGGKNALHGISRSKPILKNRVDPQIEEAVLKIASYYPAFGQQRVCNKLHKKNVYLAGGVRSVWFRHDLRGL